MKFKSIAFTGAALLITLSLLGSLHVSRKINSAVIFYNGTLSSSSALYHSNAGNLILLIKEKGEITTDGMVYVLSPHKQEVYLPSRTNYSVIPGLIFILHTDQVGARLDTGKFEVNPNVVSGDRSFAFTTALTNARVEVRW